MGLLRAQEHIELQRVLCGVRKRVEALDHALLARGEVDVLGTLARLLPGRRIAPRG